jgi:hypothetical protein
MRFKLGSIKNVYEEPKYRNLGESEGRRLV